MKVWGLLKDLIRMAHPVIYTPTEPHVRAKLVKLKAVAKKKRMKKS